MSEAMKQQFGLIQRPWGVFYLKNKTTGEQTSLKTRDRYEAERLLQAHNESESQPHFIFAAGLSVSCSTSPETVVKTPASF
jgi:hypothetical protein